MTMALHRFIIEVIAAVTFRLLYFWHPHFKGLLHIGRVIRQNVAYFMANAYSTMLSNAEAIRSPQCFPVKRLQSSKNDFKL